MLHILTNSMNEFKEQVFNILSKLITDDYILIDLPYHYNVGDILIWQSELDLLREMPHTMLYFSSKETFIKPKIGENVNIVIHGGGNFGDIWKNHQDFRLKILELFPNNPIIQLPQSVYFHDRDYLMQNISAFSKHHGKIDICLRDRRSYEFIRTHFINVETHLLPDMVLTMDLSRYQKQYKSARTLYLRREDCEYVPLQEGILPSVIEICDWPKMSGHKLLSRLLYLDNRFHSTFFRKMANQIFSLYIKKQVIKGGINLLEPYDTIYTSRLHGGILGYLLGKKVYFIKNEFYGKLEGVYDLWLRDKPNVAII